MCLTAAYALALKQILLPERKNSGQRMPTLAGAGAIISTSPFSSGKDHKTSTWKNTSNRHPSRK